MRILFWGIFFFVFLSLSSVKAYTITVDGNLNDWGLNTSSFKKNGNDWDPGRPGIFVWQEDWVESGGYVEPGYGGQKYDVEAMLATFDQENLYIAIVTGFPKNGRKKWEAGDIALDLGADGNYEYSFVLSNDNGTCHGRGLTEGGLYKVSSWSLPHYQEAAPFRFTGAAEFKGTGLFAYEDDPDHNFPRYFIEVAIPLNLFDEPFHTVKIHWTMGCGNDYGEVIAHTPEPASILLVGASLFATGLFIRRRKREG